MRTVPGSIAAPFCRAVFKIVFSTLIAANLLLANVGDSDAKKRKKPRVNTKYAAYVIDAKSGKVLHDYKGNQRRYPASLTKMMTLYLVFEDLKRGKFKKSSRVRMTKNAAKRPPSKLGIRPGQSISVEQAILSLVTKSANDVSTALAEKLSGSEPAFARRMTIKARQLGMKKTTFKNANGLTAKGQLTTAADMAKLGLALREHFPRNYRYFKTRSFKFGRRRMGNHNRLLGRVRGVDGIKTGYTRASGFNLVTSVSHGGRKIVAVVMGGRSGGSRNAAMKRLIKKYLPKATRGNQRQLIARARPVNTIKTDKIVTASVRLPKRAPKPEFSPKIKRSINARIASAHAASKPNKRDVARVKKQLLALLETPKPANRPLLKIDADPITTASVKKAKPAKKARSVKVAQAPKSGWQIQISATDSREKAQSMLAKARSKSRRSLASARTYTQAIEKNGVTLYRARFVGFASKKSAYRACKDLKRKRFNCIALKV